MPRAGAMPRRARAARAPRDGAESRPTIRAGDFCCTPAIRAASPRRTGRDALTFGNIGLYDTALFRELPRGVKLKLLPLLLDWIERGRVTGERYDGPWANVGTPADLAALDGARAPTRRAQRYPTHRRTTA